MLVFSLNTQTLAWIIMNDYHHLPMDHLLFLLSVLKDDEDRLDLIHARTSTPPSTIVFSTSLKLPLQHLLHEVFPTWKHAGRVRCTRFPSRYLTVSWCCAQGSSCSSPFNVNLIYKVFHSSFSFRVTMMVTINIIIVVIITIIVITSSSSSSSSSPSSSSPSSSSPSSSSPSYQISSSLLLHWVLPHPMEHQTVFLILLWNLHTHFHILIIFIMD